MAPSDETTEEVITQRGVFATTHWSVVLAAANSESPQASAALDKLCRTYWYPVYAYVRRRGCGPEDAQDLSQEFFARFLARNYLAATDPRHRRFRSYLLGALNHFLSDAWDRGSKVRGLSARGACPCVRTPVRAKPLLSPIYRPDRLYSSGRDGLVCGWSPDAPARASGPEVFGLRVEAMSLPHTGYDLIAVQAGGTVCRLDMTAHHTPQQLAELATDNVLVTHTGHGRLLFVAKRSGEIVAWDLDQRREVDRLPDAVPLVFLGTSRDGKLLVAIDQSRQASMWQTSTWKKEKTWAVGLWESCALSPDADFLATGRQRGQVVVWAVATGKQRTVLQHADESTTSLTFHPPSSSGSITTRYFMPAI